MRNRDYQAFDDLFRRCFPHAVNAAARIVGEAAGEDIAAEAFAKVCLDWQKVRTYTNPDGWAMRVTVNLALDALRKRTRQDRAVVLTSGPAAPHDDALALQSTLRAALRRLPRQQLTAVVLCRYIDMPAAEAAVVMGISESTVGVHVQRGLMTLRELLGDTTPMEVPLCPN